MITPEATNLLLKHFDAIDRAVSRLAMRPRPWSEVALTSYLCDLLDQDTQADQGLRYTVHELNADLARVDGLLSVRLRIDTHEYPPEFERWVTQSDIGLVLNFVDELLPHESWSRAWLLQAKRITPDRSPPPEYSVRSRLASVSSAQTQRIRTLNDVLGPNAVCYLVYGPRPEHLEKTTAQQLLHLRRKQIVNDIFDYTLGLELHAQSSRPDSTLAAGLFVASIDSGTRNLGQLHGALRNGALPFSWFLVSQLCGTSRFSDSRWWPLYNAYGPGGVPLASPFNLDEDSVDEDRIRRIVQGDVEEVEALFEELDVGRDTPTAILPRHTLVVSATVGEDLPKERRLIPVDEPDE